jgi:hypothetical protein
VIAAALAAAPGEQPRDRHERGVEDGTRRISAGPAITESRLVDACARAESGV